MSGSTLTAENGASYYTTINFTKADLANADLSGTTLTADGIYRGTIDFTEATLVNTDLSGTALTADGNYAAGPHRLR